MMIVLLPFQRKACERLLSEVDHKRFEMQASRNMLFYIVDVSRGCRLVGIRLLVYFVLDG
jgi:hypothetical protein